MYSAKSFNEVQEMSSSPIPVILITPSLGLYRTKFDLCFGLKVKFAYFNQSFGKGSAKPPIKTKAMGKANDFTSE